MLPSFEPGPTRHPELIYSQPLRRQRAWKTFHVKTEKVRPSLIVEVTSPRTKIVALETKVRQYAQAKVPYYVIANATEPGDSRRLTLIAYRLDGSTYQRVDLDPRGRAWLAPVGLWLGVSKNPTTGGDRLVLIDPKTDEEIGDYTAVDQARAAEAARADAEARARELEADLKRLKRRRSQ
jgi:colicin import membrane protein